MSNPKISIVIPVECLDRKERGCSDAIRTVLEGVSRQWIREHPRDYRKDAAIKVAANARQGKKLGKEADRQERSGHAEVAAGEIKHQKSSKKK